MFTIAKGMLGGAWALLAGWVLPSAITLVMFQILVVQSIEDGSVASSLSKTLEEEGTALIVAAVVLGWLLSTISTPLYRMLEGYHIWPRSLKKTLTQQQVHQHDRQLDKASKAGEPESLESCGAWEHVNRGYPREPEQMLPTRFGNVIRSFECYGRDRYRLDTVLLWPQLTSVAPESMARQVAESRTQVDFFVCLLYTQFLLGFIALMKAVLDRNGSPQLIAAALLGFTMVALSYRFAITAISGWADTVRAVVDVGRLPLAKALGLSVPEHIEDERRMWEAVGWWVGYPYQPEGAKRLDEFRVPSAGPQGPGNALSIELGRQQSTSSGSAELRSR